MSCALSYIVCLYFVKLWKAYVFPRSGQKGGDEKRLACFVWVFLVCTGSSISQKVTIFSLFFLLSENNTLKSSICFKQKQFSSSKMQLFQFPFVVVISWYLLSCCKHMKKCAKVLSSVSKQIFIFLKKLSKKHFFWKWIIMLVSFAENNG